MNKRIAVALVLVLAMIAFHVWFTFRDRWAIERSVRRLARLVAKDGPEPDLEALARARQISLFFTPTLEIRLPPYAPEIRDRQELAALAHQARASADAISIHIYDMATIVSRDRREATLSLTARGTVRRGPQEDSDVRELEIQWVRAADGWKISAVREVVAIRPPDSGG